MVRYVRHFNQEWYQELIEDFQRAFEEISLKLNGYNNHIKRNVTTIEPSPVMGARGMIHPFPIAEKVYEIYQWLTGNRKRPPKHTEETMGEILELAFFNPFIDMEEIAHDIEWERWKSMNTGSFYYATNISLRLHKGQSINASELAFLTHVNQVTVLKQIRTKKFSAIKDGNVWRIDAITAIEWIQEYNDKNPFDKNTESEWVLQEQQRR